MPQIMIMVYELKPLLNLEGYHENVLYRTTIMSLLNKTKGIKLLAKCKGMMIA